MISTHLTRPLFSDPVEAEFSDASLLRDMVRVEAALARAQVGAGLVPEAAAAAIAGAEEGFEPDVAALEEGVVSAGVPVPALVAQLRKAVGPDHADFVHYGATSQDIVDTALVLAYGRALEELGARLGRVIDGLEAASAAHGDVVMLARTRGQLATPISFGLRVAQWAQPLIAAEADLARVRAVALKVQFGGASGSQSAVAPHGMAIAEGMAAELGLAAAPPWHTDRSGVQALAGWLGAVVTGLAKMAGDLVIGSRGEVAEVTAGAGGGSSTMPHKSNPVGPEAILTAERLARPLQAGLAGSAVQTEERDGAAWPVEWLLLPQLCVTCGAALARAEGLVATLAPRAEAMAARIEGVPEVMAEAAVFALSPRIGRRAAQDMVTAAMADPVPLAKALAARGPEGINWAEELDPKRALAPARAVAEAIFARRHPRD